MIYPYFSNSYEFLKALFLQHLRQERESRRAPAGAFALSEAVIPDEAVRDDINRALADDCGIASAVRFVTTQAWLDRMNYASLDVSGRARALEWAVYAVVSDADFLNRPVCARLKHYAEHNPQSSLWPLACRIAAVFSVYFSYRADWLWNWAGIPVLGGDVVRRQREDKVLAAHPDFIWQKELWSELCTRRKADGSPLWPTAEAFLSIPEHWRQNMNEAPPQRAPIYFFLPRELPPLALPQLLVESRRRPVYVYVLNPSSAFWFDASVRGQDGFAWFHRNAASRRALIDRVRTFVAQDAAAPEAMPLESESAGFFAEHKARTVPVEALSDVFKLRADAQEIEDIYVRPHEDSFLSGIQRSVLEDDPSHLKKTVPEGDDSFLIVRAPNAVREVETLCDWIAAMIESSRGSRRPLAASDFLVVTPDIDAMAGVVAAVMGSRSEENRLSYHIAGQAELSVNSTARAMLSAMRFAGGAAAADDFFELIEMPAFAAIRPQSSFNATRIASWLAAAGYRWGLNEAHARSAVRRRLAEVEGDGPFEGTLERALERLVAGRLIGRKTAAACGVLAMNGCELAGFESTDDDPESFDFLLSLAQAFADAGELARMQTPEQWLETTRRFADALFAGYARSSDMTSFMMRASSLAASADDVLGESEISFETWCGALENTLRSSKTAARATGRVTFARTGDFTGLPFRCVAVIGLNDGETFPGSRRREEFDLTDAKIFENGCELNAARRGDRDLRESNRGVFLDLLLAAREHFYVSYSIGSGAVPANPSVVLQDLKQALARGLDAADELEAKLTKTVSILAASPESFAPEMGALRVRSAALARAVNQAAESKGIADEPAFADIPIASRRGMCLAVSDLAKFFSYPESKSLRILGLASREDELPQTAPVVRFGDADKLFRSMVRRRIYQEFREGEAPERINAALACDPTLGEQSVRGLLVGEAVREMQGLHERVLEKKKTTQQRRRVRLFADRLFVDDAQDRPFDSLAVPALDCVVDESGRALAVCAGISQSDFLPAFLHFAAANVLLCRRRREDGELQPASVKEVDFFFARGKPEDEKDVCWSLHAPAFGQTDSALAVLEHVLGRMLALVNAHLSGKPILADEYLTEDDSLIWRGIDGFARAQSLCGALIKSASDVAGLFDMNAGQKKKRTNPLDAFDDAADKLEAGAAERVLKE